MNIAAIRGAILEEIVLHLLEMVGYRTVKAGEEGTLPGHAGLEIQGRGEVHQIDALAAFDHTPPFMYPLRLLVEAKCYKPKNTVGIDVVRNAVGVLKDISENYFSYSTSSEPKDSIKAPRYNYLSAIFSTSGYTENAVKYAIAHQIFLIQYQKVYALKPVIKALLKLNESHIFAINSPEINRRVRERIRSYFGVDGTVDGADPFSEYGSRYIRAQIIAPLDLIRGSYFGMLQGRWPIHLLSYQPLPPELFMASDVVPCKVYGRIGGEWSFVPLHYSERDALWFRLSFDLPKEIAKLVAAANGNLETVAQLKTQHFSYISLSGIIGGVRRQVRLELDRDWIRQYLPPEINE